jgi:hypothetical protein
VDAVALLIGFVVLAMLGLRRYRQATWTSRIAVALHA